MANHRFKLLIPVFIVTAIAVGVLSINVGSDQKYAPTQTITIPATVLAAPIESEIVSPDGKVNLLVKEKKEGTNTIWTANIENNQVFKEEMDNNVSIVVPFNTFSPDNKYIFLEKKSLASDLYIVLATSGKPILQDGSTLEISKLFYNKYSEYKITDVTGWAAPTLIVVNTDKITGGQGPSFWFDVSTKSFYRLSTRFN